MGLVVRVQDGPHPGLRELETFHPLPTLELGVNGTRVRYRLVGYWDGVSQYRQEPGASYLNEEGAWPGKTA